MLPATNSVRSEKYLSFLNHLIIHSQIHMYIEHKRNDARHGIIFDGNTYTVIWPEGSGEKPTNPKYRPQVFTSQNMYQECQNANYKQEYYAGHCLFICLFIIYLFN